MHDRFDAVRGRLKLRSALGTGTALVGPIPASAG